MPSPPESGMSEVMRNSNASGGCSAREAAHHEVAAVARDREVGDDREAPGLHHLDLDVHRQRRGEHVEARAEVRGGGRDADPAPAPHGPRTARSTASMSGSQGTTEPAWPSATCGSFSPWPGEHADDPRRRPPAPCLQQPRHARGRGRLAEHALVRRQPAVGVEDLGVGDRADRALRRGHRAHRLLPARRVADPDRARDRLGVLDRLAVTSGADALGLPAQHPRRRARLLKALPVRGDVARVADRDAERVDLADLVDASRTPPSSAPPAGTG